MRATLEIVLTQDVKLGTGTYKTGSVFIADEIDMHGFACVYSIACGFFSNEYELYVPCLENK